MEFELGEEVKHDYEEGYLDGEDEDEEANQSDDNQDFMIGSNRPFAPRKSEDEKGGLISENQYEADCQTTTVYHRGNNVMPTTCFLAGKSASTDFLFRRDDI